MANKRILADHAIAEDFYIDRECFLDIAILT